MKNLRLLILTALLVTLSACGGEPFGPELFAAYGPGGEAGQGPALGAAGDPDAAAGAPDASSAGTGGQPASGGSAGALAQGGTSTGGVSAAGAAQGGGAPAAGSDGTTVTPPPEPPCSPSTIVTGKVKMDLGVVAQCLRTTADIDYLACSNWDGREIRVNGKVEPCWVKFPAAPAIDGWNYIQVEPGSDAMANLDWSVI